MTNEEAIIALKRIRKDWQFTYSYDCEAVEIAIRALKNEQTDGDLISRQAVLDLPKIKHEPIKGYGIIEYINVDDIKKLPSAEKTAEWIFWTSKSAKCSNCGHIQFTNGEDTTKNTLIHKALYHYCPMCGAKMKWVEE